MCAVARRSRNASAWSPSRKPFASPGRSSAMPGESHSGTGVAVGERWARVDGRAKVRGELRYAADQPLRPCLDVAIHRGTRPHARIASIDTTRARAMDGVVAVVTGADLYALLGDRLLTGPAFADQPCLALGRVRYVGEPVAAVLARGVDAARAAAEEIEVDYA